MMAMHKILSGIIWSIVFFIGSGIVSLLVTIGLGDLLTTANILNDSIGNTVTYIIGKFILILGTIAGFYIGYTRPQKKDNQKAAYKNPVRKLVYSVIVVFIISIVGYTIYANLKVYQSYGYFVQVSAEDVFVSRLDPSNPLIVDHGRMLKEKIRLLDNKIDRGDGHKEGFVRWYGCSGIDCDEGWESHIYK